MSARIFGPGSELPLERKGQYFQLERAVKYHGAAVVFAVKNGLNAFHTQADLLANDVMPFADALFEQTDVQPRNGIATITSAAKTKGAGAELDIRFTYDTKRTREALRALAISANEHKDDRKYADWKEYTSIMLNFLTYMRTRHQEWGDAASSILTGEPEPERKVLLKKKWREFAHGTGVTKGYMQIVPALKGPLLELLVLKELQRGLPEGTLYWRWPVKMERQYTIDGGARQEIKTEYESAEDVPADFQLKGRTMREKETSIDYRLCDIIVAAPQQAIITMLDHLEEVAIVRARPADLYALPQAPRRDVGRHG